MSIYAVGRFKEANDTVTPPVKLKRASKKR